MNKLQGNKLAGGNPSRGRVEDDFYATPELATKVILEREDIMSPILEPACGQGHIAKLLPEGTETTDLIYRGYGVGEVDFLKKDYFDRYGTVITNPPFNLFQEFAEKALKISSNKIILFGKLQALEGQKRATFLEKSPLRTVYIFKKRINPLRNGSPLDENGKPWASTMAFAWYVWEIGYKGNPIIKWI